MTSCNTNPTDATRVRVFFEDYQWSVDLRNDAGEYSDRVWSYDTWADAIAGIPAFIASFNL